MGNDAFISYASGDRRVAEHLCRVLESRGLKCWIAPRDVRPGYQWAAEIDNALARSRALVLVFSEQTSKSNWVLKELTVAASTGLRIFTVRISDARPGGPFNIILSDVHWTDAMIEPRDAQFEYIADAIIAPTGSVTNSGDQTTTGPSRNNEPGFEIVLLTKTGSTQLVARVMSGMRESQIEARRRLDNLPAPVAWFPNEEDAESFGALLRTTGATASIRPALAGGRSTPVVAPKLLKYVDTPVDLEWYFFLPFVPLASLIESIRFSQSGTNPVPPGAIWEKVTVWLASLFTSPAIQQWWLGTGITLLLWYVVNSISWSYTNDLVIGDVFSFGVLISGLSTLLSVAFLPSVVPLQAAVVGLVVGCCIGGMLVRTTVSEHLWLKALKAQSKDN